MDTARIAELLDPFLRAPIKFAEQNKNINKDEPDQDRQCKDQNKGHDNSVASNITNNVCVLSNAQLEHISTYIDILIH